MLTASAKNDRSRVLHGSERASRGTFCFKLAYHASLCVEMRQMDGLIYLIGLIVIIMAILSFFGLR